MNWDHVRAVMIGFVRSDEVDGVKIVTEGHMCCRAPEPWKGVEPPPLKSAGNMWRDCLSLSPVELFVPPNECEGTGREIARDIGGEWVAERFVRCFPATAMWSSGKGAKAKNGERMRLAWDGEQLLGFVMPLSEPPNLRTPWRPTDEDVYSPYACEENDWYLIAGKEIQGQIELARAAITRAENRLEEAEAQIAAERANLRRFISLAADRQEPANG